MSTGVTDPAAQTPPPVPAPPSPAPAPEPPVTVIEPRPGWGLPDLRELWRYRELFFFLAARDIKLRYKQTVLGLGWAVAQPLATMGVFVLFLGKIGGLSAGVENYALFVHKADGKEFDMRPSSYGVLAFSQAARGKTMGVNVDGAEGLDVTAYGYQAADGGQSVVMLNKTFGPNASEVTVTIKGAAKGKWQSMTLQQKDADIAAKDGITLAGAGIDPTGAWDGKWTDVAADANDALSVTVKPTSAIVLRVAAGH